MTKVIKITRVPTIGVSKCSPGFMIQMNFSSFNIEIIGGFTSNILALCFDTSYPSGFPYRSKRPHLDILKFLVTTLSNQDNKVAFVRVDEDGSLARSYEFMETSKNMNIVVKTTGGDTSSLNSKIEIPNNKLYNITKALILNSSYKQDLWCFAYKYSIWISFQTDNRFSSDVLYFLWYITRPSYKQIKI